LQASANLAPEQAVLITPLSPRHDSLRPCHHDFAAFVINPQSNHAPEEGSTMSHHAAALSGLTPLATFLAVIVLHALVALFGGMRRQRTDGD
jgi:hypothetical protein